MRYLLTLALFLIAGEARADYYEFDKDHTHIAFRVNHLGFSDMLGLFTGYSGSLQFDPNAPAQSVLDITLHPIGIHTTSTLLDRALQGDQFFNTARYPDIRFVSTAVTVTGDNTGDVQGNLTLLGVTKPLTLHVTFNKAAYHPVTNLYTAGFSATASLKRSDYGMTYLIPGVSDDVRIDIETEATDIDKKNAEKIKH